MKLGPYELDQIYTGDARELARAIPDESIDLIFTDPPYDKDALPLFRFLSELGARVLKSDGFLLTYCGGYWKNIVMRLLDTSMDYFFDYAEINNGNSTILWPRRTIVRHKSILAYVKQGSKALPRTNVLGVWQSDGSDKRYHKWGQSENTSRYFIDCFSARGAIVLDPFIGGGTTRVICERLNRHYLAFEIDSDTAERARRRVQNTQPPLFVPQPEQIDMFGAER